MLHKGRGKAAPVFLVLMIDETYSLEIILCGWINIKFHSTIFQSSIEHAVPIMCAFG